MYNFQVNRISTINVKKSAKAFDLDLLGDGLLAEVKFNILMEGSSQQQDRVHVGLVHYLKHTQSKQKSD